MTKGTYTILIALPSAAEIEVGALGPRAFDAGWYAYTGTAFGPGGFSRVDRHRAVAAGKNEARHWHVDRLLGHPETTVEADFRTPGLDAECAVTDALAGDRVPGFGASDCDCGSHLVYAPDRKRLVESAVAVHEDGTTIQAGRTDDHSA